MSSFVVSAVTRAGAINYSLPGDADPHNSSRLPGWPPPSLTAAHFNTCLPESSWGYHAGLPIPTNDSLGWINPLNTNYLPKGPWGLSRTPSFLAIINSWSQQGGIHFKATQVDNVGFVSPNLLKSSRQHLVCVMGHIHFHLPANAFQLCLLP